MRVYYLLGAAAISVASLISTSVSLFGASDKKEGAKGNVKVLEGEWEIVNVMREGLETGGGFRGGAMVIKGETFTALLDGKPTGRGTVKLDISKKPPTIDLTYTTGSGKGTKRLGVFSANGDFLTIALAAEDKDRPANLESKPDSGVTIYEYRRKKD